MQIRTAVKNLVKKLLRPVWTRVRARIDHRLLPVEAAIGDLSRRLAKQETNQVLVLERLERLEALEKGWRQHVPALLNATSSIAAFGYELAKLWKSAEQTTTSIGDLWHRIEFVRREILYELKYGVTSARPEITVQILSPDKVEKARAGGIRLNLGCGHLPLDGYINVDQRELPGVDIISDVSNLPFEENSVTEIFSAHVLEHFPQERLRRLLPYWRSLLKPQGAFRAIVPDGEAMLSGVAAGTYPFEQFREVLFGAQEYEGDFHFNLFTPDSLSNLLVESGFKKVAVPVKGRPNGICFEFEILAARG